MTRDDKWLEKIEKELENAKNNGEVSPKIIELVSELRIHQTELEMQNDELRHSQEELAVLYHELYNDMPVGYFILDKDGIIRNVNSKGAELLLLTKNEIIGRGFSKFIVKEDENKYFSVLSDMLKISDEQELELQFKRFTTIFYANVKITPLYHRKGAKYRIIIEDITKNKKSEMRIKELLEENPQFAEELEVSNEELQATTEELRLANEELKESEERYKNLIEALPNAMIVHGEGKIKFVNLAALELFKAGDETELIGKPILSILSPEMHEIGKQRIKQAESEQTPFKELKYKRLDGSLFYGEATGKSIIYQGKPAIQFIIRDITERKNAEEVLKRSEETARQRAEELKKLMDMSPASIFLSEDPYCQSIVGNEEGNRMYEVDRGSDVSAGTIGGEVLNVERRFFKDGKELKPEELPMQLAVKKGEDVLNYEMP